MVRIIGFTHAAHTRLDTLFGLLFSTHYHLRMPFTPRPLPPLFSSPHDYTHRAVNWLVLTILFISGRHVTGMTVPAHSLYFIHRSCFGFPVLPVLPRYSVPTLLTTTTGDPHLLRHTYPATL